VCRARYPGSDAASLDSRSALAYDPCVLEYTAGLVLGSVNKVRHRARGYRTPRPVGVCGRQHAEKIVRRWLSHIDPSGKRILEIGPGSDLLTGELLLASGAVEYTAVDAFSLAEPQPPIEYVVTSFPMLPDLEGEYDLVVSNATLEHLDDVPATFLRLSELTADGGAWCHYVDAKTHMRWIKDRDPLNLLRYSDAVYGMMSFPGIPNRLRASDYVAAAAGAGFALEVHAGRRADPRYLDCIRTRTHRHYPRSDLSLLSFMLTGSRRRG
jgi:Methyltransferase domain